MILLDTSVLSAVLRRRRRGPREQELAATVAALLTSDASIGLPGIVLQEILSGIADPGQARRVLSAIRASFPVFLATERDHVAAADISSAAAGRGIALSAPVALIAAQAVERGAALFTTDEDFRRIAGFTRLRVLD